MYNTNVEINQSDEIELNSFRPDLNSFPTPSQFKQMVNEIHQLSQFDLDYKKDMWTHANSDADIPIFESVLEKAKSAVKVFQSSSNWEFKCIQAGYEGDLSKQPWESLADFCLNAWEQIKKCHSIVVEWGPETTTDNRDCETQLCIIKEAITFIQEGGKFNYISRITRKNTFNYLKTLKIKGKPARLELIEHLKAVEAKLQIDFLRGEFCGRWERLITANGGPIVTDFGEKPEDFLLEVAQAIRSCLHWKDKQWQIVENDLVKLGFDWPKYLYDTKADSLKNSSHLIRLRDAIQEDFERVIECRSAQIMLNAILNKLSRFSELLNNKLYNNSFLSRTFNHALLNRDTIRYEHSYNELTRVLSVEPVKIKRKMLIDKLFLSAPSWATAISQRAEPHNLGKIPGNPTLAWEWRQLHDEIVSRNSISIKIIEDKIERLVKILHEITQKVVERKAWLNQVRSIKKNPNQKQALVAYSQFYDKLTKTGKGKLDSERTAAMRREMSIAKNAVPVWIMPISEVADSFDPRSTRFDVVIIDEASQCDPSSLFVTYMAKQVIVVGDHEQVSPLNVGIDLSEIIKLIRVHLEGIPRKELYDGQTSIYDFAQIAFGKAIRLVEHFRCAPDIIAFSNSLSYNNEIRPLREASSIQLQPAIVHFKTASGTCNSDNTNNEEAITIASLICAATKIPHFSQHQSGKPTSYGVISLLGDKQALCIDTLLRSHLDPEIYTRHKVLCGNAAQFQGDERDIIFVSLVDATTGNPLPLNDGTGHNNAIKKRYNVAASRARDQMWVVHSLNHTTDLKPLDIRRRLIEHALDPNSWERELDRLKANTESPFEEQVLKRLFAKGYKIVPQYKVGAYRIDLVVYGKDGKKLAVECDGERFHGLDKLQEDIERQAILERLNWRFVRIRGSAFFRDPEIAMVPVFERLQELEIEPLGQDSPFAEPSEPNEKVQELIRIANELKYEWNIEENTENVKSENKNVWCEEKSNTDVTPKKDHLKSSLVNNKIEKHSLSQLTIDLNNYHDDKTKIRENSIVVHPNFGRGVVIKAIDDKVIIQFKNAIKDIKLSVAMNYGMKIIQF